MNEGNQNIILLVLCRKVIANLLVEAVEKRSNMTVFAEYNYKNVRAAAMTLKPDIALAEIPQCRGTPALDTLDICAEIKSESPGCKIMLLCPENSEESISVCVKAKQKAQIEDFLFYDSSTNYLVSKLESMIMDTEPA